MTKTDAAHFRASFAFYTPGEVQNGKQPRKCACLQKLSLNWLIRHVKQSQWATVKVIDLGMFASAVNSTLTEHYDIDCVCGAAPAAAAAALGLFRVISAFCGTPVAQNAEITRKSQSSEMLLPPLRTQWLQHRSVASHGERFFVKKKKKRRPQWSKI